MHVEIEVLERAPERLTAAVRGELDLATRDALRSDLAPLLTAAPTVVLDLADVAFIDATGLKVLAAAARQARERGGRLVLANPSRLLVRMLALLDLHELLPVEPTS